MADKIKFPYELALFRGRNGELSGAMVIDNPGDSARGIKADEMLPFVSTLNVGALARVDQLTTDLASVTAQLEAYKTRGLYASKAVIDILENPDLTPEQKAAAIKAVAQDVQAEERERNRLAALAELAAAQAKVDKFA